MPSSVKGDRARMSLLSSQYLGECFETSDTFHNQISLFSITVQSEVLMAQMFCTQVPVFLPRNFSREENDRYSLHYEVLGKISCVNNVMLKKCDEGLLQHNSDKTPYEKTLWVKSLLILEMPWLKKNLPSFCAWLFIYPVKYSDISRGTYPQPSEYDATLGSGIIQIM